MNSELLNGLTFAGIIGSMVAWGKAAAWRLLSLVIVRVELANAGAIGDVLEYLRSDFTRSPFYARRFIGTYPFVKPLKKYSLVFAEQFGGDQIVFWKGVRPIFTNMGKEKSKSDSPAMELGNMTVSFVRGTFRIEDIFREIVRRKNQFSAEEFVPRACGFYVSHLTGNRHQFRSERGEEKPPLHTSSGRNESLGPGGRPDKNILFLSYFGWKTDDIGDEPMPGDKAFRHLAFGEEVAALRQDLHRWLNNCKWYRDKQIAWRRGWLIEGQPGNGKSSLIRALAMSEGLPLFTFDLSTMVNANFIDCWSKVSANGPAIAAIEDIDAVFHGRENITGADGLTFDCFLNVLSGVSQSEGIFLIITTNHPEHLDPALGVMQVGTNISSRPGRIDRTLQLNRPTEDGLRRIASWILSEYPEEIPGCLAAGLIGGADGKGDSGAQFVERCSQIALRRFWESKG